MSPPPLPRLHLRRHQSLTASHFCREVRHSPNFNNQDIPLFSTAFPLLVFPFFLGILPGPLLSTLLCSCYAWYYVVKWVLDNTNRLDFRGTVNLSARDRYERGLTDYTGRPSLSISVIRDQSGCPFAGADLCAPISPIFMTSVYSKEVSAFLRRKI